MDAHAPFWGLLLDGWRRHELERRGFAVFPLLWIAGLYRLPYTSLGAALFSSFVATLDIAFVIFKGMSGSHEL
jgi:hypothetical protein